MVKMIQLDMIEEQSILNEIDVVKNILESYSKILMMDEYIMEDAVQLNRGESISLNEAAKKANEKDNGTDGKRVGY